ncbi:MAG: hypothetical protein D6679_14230 [Candidatus Hydrogenedentota bacterium]|nr:MAG: hypothetical protein D6679_14230 [Candidatus Hydrogenedentota bacterium]
MRNERRAAEEERNGLFRRILDFQKRGYAAERDERLFEELALSVARYQNETNPVLHRLSAGSLERIEEIPLVPTNLFSRFTIFSFDPSEAVAVFSSSGTTRSKRGRHFFRDLSLYRNSVFEGLKAVFGGGRYRVRSLISDEAESSLARMISWMKEYWREADLSDPVLVIGPAFSFVRLIDSGGTEPLPDGSLVIETGGYKGRSRTLEKREFYEALSRYFEVPEERILSEYGMCEISSPMWEEPPLRAGEGARRGFRVPPWVRVKILDPATLRERDEGRAGVIAILDLANLDSSIGILTGDWGEVKEGRLLLSGRAEGSEAKGCSLNVEE